MQTESLWDWVHGVQATTHMELDEKAMLSAVAQLTPFSDFNQSPRNMYQCQVHTYMLYVFLHTESMKTVH